MNTVIRIFYTIESILFLVLTSIFLVVNAQLDIDQSLSVACVIFANFAIVSIYFNLLRNSKQFHAMLNELQDVVSESEE